METNLRRGLVLGAVATGSLLLFGPLTYVLLVNLVGSIVTLVGVGPLSGWAGLAVVLGAGLIALKTAGEVAMIRIHGYQVLRRGSGSQILVRHAALTAPVIGATLLLMDFLADMILWGVTENGVAILGLSLGIIVALMWTAVRSIEFYQQGRQRAS